ncbi:MAG: hypothetical protein Q9224_005595 [Gallowayella concinna]
MRHEAEPESLDEPAEFHTVETNDRLHCGLADESVPTVQSSTHGNPPDVVANLSKKGEHGCLHEMSDASAGWNTEKTADAYYPLEEEIAPSAADKSSGRISSAIEGSEHDKSHQMFIASRKWDTADEIVAGDAFHLLELEEKLAPETGDANDGANSRSTDHVSHQGLGTLSIIPPEIRSEIWQQLFLHAVPRVAKIRPQVYESLNLQFAPQPTEEHWKTKCRKQKALASLEASKHSVQAQDFTLSTLSIMCASKSLCNEVMGEFYRNRTLIVCFNCNEHSLILEREEGKLTWFYTKIGDVCVARDFSDTDLSKFVSIHLEIELPSDECSGKKLEDLTTHMGEFVELLQTWRSRHKKATGHWRSYLKVSVAVRLYKGIQLYSGGELSDDEWYESPWEINLLHIYDLLLPLCTIGYADATIDVYFRLRYGQEWLPHVLHETIAWMGSGIYQFPVLESDTFQMCMEADHMTRITLGSTEEKSLSKKPAEILPLTKIPHQSFKAYLQRYYPEAEERLSENPSRLPQLPQLQSESMLGVQTQISHELPVEASRFAVDTTMTNKRLDLLPSPEPRHEPPPAFQAKRSLALAPKTRHSVESGSSSESQLKLQEPIQLRCKHCHSLPLQASSPSHSCKNESEILCERVALGFMQMVLSIFFIIAMTR